MKKFIFILLPLLLFAQQKEVVFSNYMLGMDARWDADSVYLGHRVTHDTMLTYSRSNLTSTEETNIYNLYQKWKRQRDVFSYQLASIYNSTVNGISPPVPRYTGRFILREDRIATIDSSQFRWFKSTRRSITQAGGYWYWVCGYDVGETGYQYLIDNVATIDYFVPYNATMDSLRTYLNDITSIPVWTVEE